VEIQEQKIDEDTVLMDRVYRPNPGRWWDSESHRVEPISTQVSAIVEPRHSGQKD
jgi:hypothetical protein